MSVREVPLVLPTESNPAAYGHAGRTRMVNCRAVAEGDGAKTNIQIHPVYGWADYLTLSAGQKVRALFSLDSNTLLSVCGRFLHRTDSAGTATVVGGIPTDGPVQMVRNRRLDAPQVLIVTDGRAYVYQAGTLTEVGDPDYAAAIGVTVFNGYGILPGPQGKWQISGLDDFTSFDALEFAYANSLPDEIVSAINLEGGIALLGERSVEFWSDSGGADFPFVRSGVREVGCAAGASVTRVGRAVMFIGHDRTVRLLTGYEPQKVSNPGLDRALDRADLSIVDAFSYEAEGHTFYQLSWGSDLGANSATWVFDVATGKWHERESYGYTRCRATCYAYHNGRHIVGDGTGRLYIMGRDYHDEAGQPLIVDVQPAPVDTFPNGGIVHQVDLDAVPGVGIDTASTERDQQPVVSLSYSDDGGRNFGRERTRGLGSDGEFRARVRWLACGQVNSVGRIWRFRADAAVARAFLRASMNVEKRET
ncbi:hypothetical protein [uncultured Paracoccus sp.]|uniref:hypothetical protein n=1 Tax=uncultured Paracoccus sp. TaxID=189685 RepID=UPI002610FB8F|nr:hypothetical protein [uncultured Paracoccus sp.]